VEVVEMLVDLVSQPVNLPVIHVLASEKIVLLRRCIMLDLVIVEAHDIKALPTWIGNNFTF
jgi:hypothetical protein